MAPPRRSVRLARELAFDPAARLENRHVSPHVLRHLCRLADDKISCGDPDWLRVVRLGCRIADRLRTDEARALSFAPLVTGLALTNRLGHAERAVEIALAAAPTHLKGDLIRRRSIVRMYQGRLSEALEDARTAVELAAGGRSHAVALEVLGIVLYYRGETRAAIRELARALAETDPDADILYDIAIQNYANALGQGTDEEAARALELCAELRSRLKDRHKVQRAKLWWTEGLLHYRFGDLQAAWWALDIARRSLVALKAAPEIAAITADMAQISPQPLAVRHLCYEAAEVITAPHPLTGYLRTLESAAEEEIPTAAAALREAATRLAPCPAL